MTERNIDDRDVEAQLERARQVVVELAGWFGLWASL
jgi:hypothetical protein